MKLGKSGKLLGATQDLGKLSQAPTAEAILYCQKFSLEHARDLSQQPECLPRAHPTCTHQHFQYLLTFQRFRHENGLVVSPILIYLSHQEKYHVSTCVLVLHIIIDYHFDILLFQMFSMPNCSAPFYFIPTHKPERNYLSDLLQGRTCQV